MADTASLVKDLSHGRDVLFAALGTPSFYAEVLLIGLAVTLAGMVAMLINRRIAIHLREHPTRRIDPEFISKPLALLAPLLALFYLAVIKPFAEQYGAGGQWTKAAITITFAYLLARCVMLIIKSRLVAWFAAFIIMSVAVLNVTGFMASTEGYLDSMALSFGTFKISVLSLLHGIIILIIVLWGAGLSSRTLESYLRRSSGLSYSARELTVKFFKIFVYFTAVMITLSAVGVDLTAFAVFGGALGVGIGLGLQRITANFVSGITLLMEKSVRIGDLVDIGDIGGWVRQLNIRYTLIETFDGREVLIPNEDLLANRVTNWTHSNTRARIDIVVRVAYDSDPDLVRKLVIEAANEHTLCLKDPAPACHLREFGDNSLNFLLTFWVPDVRDGRFGPQSNVMIAILHRFREHGIRIPFPQHDVHLAGGWPGMKAG